MKQTNKYIEHPCKLCGKPRSVRLLKGKPESDLCHHCAVRTPEYKAKISAKLKEAYARGDFAT